MWWGLARGSYPWLLSRITYRDLKNPNVQTATQNKGNNISRGGTQVVFLQAPQVIWMGRQFWEPVAQDFCTCDIVYNMPPIIFTLVGLLQQVCKVLKSRIWYLKVFTAQSMDHEPEASQVHHQGARRTCRSSDSSPRPTDSERAL